MIDQVRIWDYFNNRKHTWLVDSSKTLEESNLQMDQPVSIPDINIISNILSLLFIISFEVCFFWDGEYTSPIMNLSFQSNVSAVIGSEQLLAIYLCI